MNNNLESIKEKFQTIKAHMASIDPKWAQAHATIPIYVGSFANDGALYYCISECTNSNNASGGNGSLSYTGGIKITITNHREAEELADTLRDDVHKVREIAMQIQAANIPTNDCDKK